MLSDRNKRIAINTLLLYLRILFTQILALYTSRKILEALGVEDFGIYGVVGGVVTMMTFLNGSMSVATSRYLATELGRNDMQAYQKVFSMAVIIHLVLAALILLCAETIGLWAVNNFLVIPPQRMFAANCIYQTSIVIVLIGIIQAPYMASITSHEHMNMYAYVGVGESVVQLLIAFILIRMASVDTLILYGLLVMSVSITTAIIYRVYCIKQFKECKFKRQWDNILFKEMFGFTGWNLFGTIAWILKGSGIDILMNLSGGPVVNAARSVSGRVSGALTNLVGGFSTAVNPQITKSYASKDVVRLHKLLMTGTKIQYFLLLLLVIPVTIEIAYILDLWLVEVPPHTVWFVRIILIECLANTLGGPIITGLMANGDIKWYQIIVGSIMLLIVPVGYIFIKIGLSVEYLLVGSLIVVILAHAVRLAFAKRMIELPIKRYITNVVIPIIIVSIISFAIPLSIYFLLPEGFLRLCVVVIVSLTTTAIISFFLGFNSAEKAIVLTMGNSLLRKLHIIH